MEATYPYAIKKWIWELNHQLTILSRPARGHQGSSQELENLEKNEKLKKCCPFEIFPDMVNTFKQKILPHSFASNRPSALFKHCNVVERKWFNRKSARGTRNFYNSTEWEWTDHDYTQYFWYNMTIPKVRKILQLRCFLTAFWRSWQRPDKQYQ